MSDKAAQEGQSTHEYEAGQAGEAAPPPLPPLWRRVIDVFFSPGKVMEAVAANPKPWGAALVGGLLIGLAGFLIPAEVYEEFVRATALERGDAVPGNLEQMGSISRTFSLISGPIFWVLWSLLLAGIVTLIFIFVMGGRGRFKQYFATLTHSLIIPAVGNIALVPLRIANENPREVLSLGTFLGGILPEGYVLDLFSAIDLFGLAGWAVLAIGVNKIDPERSWGAAFSALFLLSVLIAALFAIFM